jgi:hypothetical protein
VRVKISDGVREVEIEIATDDLNCLSEVEASVQRMYSVVAPGEPGTREVGFTGAGWALQTETERSQEE